MYFDSIPSTIILYLLGVALLLTLIAGGYALVQSLRLARTRRFCDAADKEAVAFEPVSVIVYSQDEAEALEALLREIIDQDYPSPMEIIVVNEGESMDVRDTVAMMQTSFSSIYLTFTPDGARNLSRKKLALTLGVKAARYATVVLTAVGARISSRLWLRSMMRHFSPDGDVEVVLGYAGVVDGDDTARGAACRAFDSAVGAARWIGAAIGGHPFRGSEYNLAYRRELFFRNKGFSRSLNLHFGDDDIFISEIASGQNTAVELSDDSIVALLSADYAHDLRRSGIHRLFTEKHIRCRPRLWAALAMSSVPLSILCVAVALAADWQNGFTVLAAMVVMASLFSSLIVCWRRSLKALNAEPLGASIPLLAATYSLRRLLLRLRARFGHQKRYTWD